MGIEPVASVLPHKIFAMALGLVVGSCKPNSLASTSLIKTAVGFGTLAGTAGANNCGGKRVYVLLKLKLMWCCIVNFF